MSRLTLALIFICLAAPVQAAARKVSACALGELEPVTVAAITAQLDLQLDDGRVLKMPGLAPEFGHEVARKALENLIKDHTVLARVLSPQPDRWGRVLAQVAVEENDEPASLAEKILEQGLARMRPAPEMAACASTYLAAEAAAREAALGLWADGSFTVYPAEAPETLDGLGGKFVLIEGVVARYGSGRNRNFLDFGPRRNIDLSVTVLKKSLKAFGKARQDLASLRGHRIRVRGILDTRFGLSLIHI